MQESGTKYGHATVPTFLSKTNQVSTQYELVNVGASTSFGFEFIVVAWPAMLFPMFPGARDEHQVYPCPAPRFAATMVLGTPWLHSTTAHAVPTGVATPAYLLQIPFLGLHYRPSYCRCRTHAGRCLRFAS